MDEVLSLKPTVAIKRLQAAVRESQGTTRASYAACNRPAWWKENVSVVLPDETIAKTGDFVSHSKRAWKPEQVKATLALFYRHLEEDHPSESMSHSDLNGDSPPKTKAKAEQVQVDSRPSRTRHKTEQTRLQRETVRDVSSQKFASEPLTRSQRQTEKRKGVTFRDEHEAIVHHTPPRNFRRRKRGPIQVTPESSSEQSPSTRASSSRLKGKRELSEAKLESEVEQHQPSPSPSPVRRATPRRVVKKTSVKELPGLVSTRSNSTRQTLPRSVKEASTSDKVYQNSRLILKKKGKARVHKTAERTTKRSPQVRVIASDESPSVASAAEKENTSPGGKNSKNRRRSSRLSVTEGLTPKQKVGVKRNLDETLSESRTPLATLKNHDNANAVKVVKRRKTIGKKVTVRNTQKSSRKADGGAEMAVDNASEGQENLRAEHDIGTEGIGSSDQAVLHERYSTKLQPARRTSEPEDVSTGETNADDDEEPHEDHGMHEDGVENNTNMEEENEMDDEESEEVLTEEEKKEENEAIMKAIASLERAREECRAKIEARAQSLRRDLEKELEHKVDKLNQEYKMKLMRLSEQELSTLVGQMVYELEGDVNNLLVKEMESVADRILREGGDSEDMRGGSSSTQMQLQALKTPKAKSLRKAVVAATTERKRVNRERCVATRASVRRSTRKAAQTATARTREILTSAVRTKGVTRVREDVESVEHGHDTETDNISAPVMAAVAKEIARLKGMANSREGLKAFKAQLDSAFGEIV